MNAFDPMEPNTWNSPRPSNRPASPRRLRETIRAIDELSDALEAARQALSALDDPDYYEQQAAHLRQLYGEELFERLGPFSPKQPDPQFERWPARVAEFRRHLTWATRNAALAIKDLVDAETVVDVVRPPKRRRARA